MYEKEGVLLYINASSTGTQRKSYESSSRKSIVRHTGWPSNSQCREVVNPNALGGDG